MSANPDAQLPDELIVTLRKPITQGDITYSELKLREPTAGETLQWDKLDGAEADIAAVSIVSGIPRAVIEKVGARDLLKSSRYIARFLD